jgi:cation:H+ antiporter
LFLVFGFYLLIKSADVMVDGAAGLAKRFKIPKMVIGLTLVAFATSAPEGTVSIIAALQGSSDLSVGNIIGSNMANVALVLGVAALLRTIPVTRNTLTKGVPLNILALIVLIVMGYDFFFQNNSVEFNRLSLGDGIILLFFFVVFLYYIFGDLKAAQAKEVEIVKKEMRHYKDSLWFLSLLIFGGLAGILVGGKLIVDQAVVIAGFFGVSEAVIGLTVVALGTSLPELVTAVVAALKNEKDIAIGSIVGSNVFNVFLVLGLTSIIVPLNFDPALLVDAIFTLIVTLIFYIILIKERQLSRLFGSVLLSMYFLYIVSLIFREVIFQSFQVPGIV